MKSTRRWMVYGAVGLVGLSSSAAFRGAASPQDPADVIEQYCVRCHSAPANAGGLSLDRIDVDNVGEQVEVWEKTVRKLRARAMPPAGRPRPDEQGYQELLSYLEEALDADAAAKPDPGRTETFRRLNPRSSHG